MIKEAYCSFEVSKLLKEKGFNELCFRLVRNDGDVVEVPSQAWNGMTKKQRIEFCLCPTHQMAMAWLREKYGFHIYTFYENEFHWHYVIDSLTKKWRYSVSENKSNDEAIEKALKYSLENLI